MHRKLHRTYAVLLVVSLAVAACGGSESGTSSAPQTSSTAAAPTSSQAVESTSTTTSSTTTTTTEPPTTTTTSPGGTLQSPLAVGEVAQVGDWRIRVAGVTADGTDQVLAENQFNDPPAEGRQFFLVHLEATYTGTESSNFWVDMSLKAVGPSNVAYESCRRLLRRDPRSIDDSGETFPGGSIDGNACWSVTEADASHLVLIAEESLSFNDTRAYLSLDPAATPVEASTSEGVGGSSRLADAVPIGQAAEVGPWTLTVTGVTEDATKQVMAENQFNDPPGEGEQFYMAAVEATYNGDDSSTFWVDVSLKAVGDSSVAYEGFDGSCGVYPDPIDDSGETFPGGSISGNVCWKVNSDDVGSLVMIAEESFTFDNQRTFFSLTPVGSDPLLRWPSQDT